MMFSYDGDLRFRVFSDPIRNPFGSLDIVGMVWPATRDGNYGVVEPLVIKDATKEAGASPFATLGIEGAQVLMDDLWKCGIRPTEGSGTAGSMRAVEGHLSDMRRIVFHKLGIEE